MQVTHENGLETSPNKILSFNELWARYVAYWPVFILTVSAAIFGAWVYLKYTTPLYQANARIMIKDEKKGTDDTKAMESLNLMGIKKIIDNEVEVMQSRTLITEVVKNLHLYAPVSMEKQVKAVSAYTTSPVRIELANPDSLMPVNNISFTYNDRTGIVEIGKQYFKLNQWANTPFGFLKFNRNPYYKVQQKEKYFFSIVPVSIIAAGIQSRLAVTPVSKPSTILNLNLRDEVPQRGEDILNELMVVYNKASISDKNALAANTLSFVEERLQHVAHDLDSIEHKMQAYKSANNAMNLDMQSGLFQKNMSDNSQRLADLQMRMAVLTQMDKYVQAPGSKLGILPSSLGIVDENLENLLSKFYDYEMEYEKLRKTTARNNPVMVSLTDQIEKIKPLILDNLSNQRQSLQTSANDLQGTNNNYASTLAAIPFKERDVTSINREQAIRNDVYVFLLKKREETALSSASTVSDSRVVDKAQALLTAVSPNTKLIYIGAAIGALVLCIGFITARETFNSRILYRHEITNLTFRPVIAEIAFDRTRNPIVTGDGKNTFIAEQFRKLRTSLIFLGKDETVARKILITSTMPGEGKSFVAANLAISLALTGKKVVMLELDLNNPSLCSKLQIESTIGISDYLSGHADPEDVIRPVPEHANLFIIPSGPLPRNPSELIMNKRIEVLLAYLNDIFDYIVIDTAPAGALTDAYILSKHCDVTLYMIRQKFTPKTLVEHLDDNNKTSRLNNVGIVFNGIRSRGFGKPDYGYGYNYIYKTSGKKKNKKMKAQN